MRALRVGLTGGIGAGKSAALGAFRRAGAWTLSLDAVAHALSGRGGAVRKAAARAFGPGVLAADGSLDRAALARRVFADPRARRRLERAAHPPILREMRRRLARARGPVAVVDAPLLFEAGAQSDFDLTVLVTAGRAERLRRVVRRDGASRAAVARRMRAQWPERRRAALADVILPNAGSLRELQRAAREHYRAFRLLAAGAQARKP